MRRFDRTIADGEFPSRYILDEARFSGGRDRICNKEASFHETTARNPR